MGGTSGPTSGFTMFYDALVSVLAFLGAVIILYDSILAFLGAVIILYDSMLSFFGGDHSFTIHLSAFLGGCSASSRGPLRQNPSIFWWQERSQDGRKRTDYQIPRVLRAEPCRAWRQVYAYLQRTADGRRTHGRRTHARQTADGRTHGTHGTDTRTADGRTHTHGRSGPTTGSLGALQRMLWTFQDASKSFPVDDLDVWGKRERERFNRSRAFRQALGLGSRALGEAAFSEET